MRRAWFTGTFATETTIKMSKYSRDLYARLEEETGQDTGFRAVGYLQIASNPERVDKLRRIADFARGFGIEVAEISTSEVKKMWPLFETNDVLAGFYTPDDGRANPVDVTMALAKGARMGGAQLLEGVCVTGINQARDASRASPRIRETSRRSSSSTAADSGREKSERWPASTCRYTPPNITT